MRWWMCVVLVSAGCTKGSDTVDTQDTNVADTDTDVTDTDTDVDTDTDTQETGESGLVDADDDGYDISTDCNDADPAVHPDAKETCNGVDDDCDGAIDEDFDVDADGYFSYARCHDGDDCDDTDASVHPGADEIANDGIDQDCDGKDLVEGDDDLDGHIAEAKGGDDCDDTRADVHPGHVDWWNDGVDSDCDGKDGTSEDLSKMDVTIDGDPSNPDYAGYRMTTCDIDEDGSDDLIVTAPVAGGGSYSGEVAIFYGGDAATWGAMQLSDAGTVITSSTYFLGMGISCADLDGDGHVDLAAGRGDYPGYADFGVVLFYGDGNRFASTLTDGSADAELSYALGSPGDSIYSVGYTAADLDGDGASELLFLMAGSSYTNDPSQIWVLPSGRYTTSGKLQSEVSITLDSQNPDDFLSLAVAPDLDGDGNNDVVVSEVDDTGIDYADGEVSVMDLTASTDVATGRYASLLGSNAEVYGNDFAFGDFDADGLTDAAVAADWESTNASQAGAVYVHSDFAGGLTGVGLDAATDADGRVLGETDTGLFGYQLGAPGDVDGDGYDDILVTEINGNAAQTGRVWVLGGADIGAGDTVPSDSAILAFDGEEVGAAAGATLTYGDYDGDGMVDIVVAAPWTTLYSTSGTTSGRVYVILSSNRD